MKLSELYARLNHYMSRQDIDRREFEVEVRENVLVIYKVQRSLVEEIKVD